ncbi:MAG: ACT domain-containing protein [Candidatus Micrarchaeota archaeon]|nr:ACT domain-containing protein [Candidatus Micrarchaeota archaeon]
MAGKDELKLLLRSLSPSLSEGIYCIGTFDEAQMMGLAGYLKHITCIYREDEGITAVFSSGIEEEMKLYTSAKISGPFALITLGVVSPLLSVGLLAKITGALAEKGIPVNAYSAYYHDHLLVPYDKREAALDALKKLQKP